MRAPHFYYEPTAAEVVAYCARTGVSPVTALEALREDRLAGCPPCAAKDDATFVVECEGCRARHKAKIADEDAAAAAAIPTELVAYDAGILNDFGGGNVEWWQDYIRAELGRAHDFYVSQISAEQSPDAQAQDD